jgi:hypothetical protein
MRWLRLYVETLDDPKVQRLPDRLFRVWINLLCLAGKAEGRLPAPADIGFALRLREAEARLAVDALVARGLLDRQGSELWPHNWSGRQFPSDDVTARVKRYRERAAQQRGDVSNDAERFTKQDDDVSRNGPDQRRKEEIRPEQTRSPTVSLSPNRARGGAREDARNRRAKTGKNGGKLADGNDGGRPHPDPAAPRAETRTARELAFAREWGAELPVPPLPGPGLAPEV